MASLSIASKLLQITAVAALVAASLLTRPIAISAVNASLCGTPGYGIGATPVVDSVSPNRGPFDGGTSVTLTGCGFTPRPGPGGQTTVLFGSTVSASVVVGSDTQVTAIAPAHSLATVDVTVVTGYGTSPIQTNDQYTYLGRLNQCGAVTLTAIPPDASGTAVTFTANATGCWNPNPLYEFFSRPLSATVWTQVQAYSTNNVLQFDTSRMGASYVSVWAKDASSPTSGFDASATYPHEAGANPSCSPVTLASAPASPQKPGTQITFTASATCTHPNPSFEFLMRPAPSSTWTMMRSYSTNNVFEWDTTGLSGSYYIGVWVKDALSVASLDSNASVLYVVKTPTCTSVTIAATPQPPQIAGSQVTLTASASSCPSPNPLYMFWIREASNPSWAPLSSVMPASPWDGQLYPVWTTSNVFVWNTTGARAGQYYLGVWAKDASSTASADAYASTPYVINAAACGSVSISASPASPQVSGPQVTFTAADTGCTHLNPLYQFLMRPASQSTWQVVQDYSTSPTFKWNSSGTSGTFYFGVWTKDAASSAFADAYTSIPYVINPASCASVSVSAAPASPQASGTQVAFTAVASGCSNPNPLFRFWLVNGTTSWMDQPWFAFPTWTWNTTGLAPGTYEVRVWVRDAASQALSDASTSIFFQVT